MQRRRKLFDGIKREHKDSKRFESHFDDSNRFVFVIASPFIKLAYFIATVLADSFSTVPICAQRREAWANTNTRSERILQNLDIFFIKSVIPTSMQQHRFFIFIHYSFLSQFSKWILNRLGHTLYNSINQKAVSALGHSLACVQLTVLGKQLSACASTSSNFLRVFFTLEAEPFFLQTPWRKWKHKLCVHLRERD